LKFSLEFFFLLIWHFIVYVFWEQNNTFQVILQVVLWDLLCWLYMACCCIAFLKVVANLSFLFHLPWRTSSFKFSHYLGLTVDIVHHFVEVIGAK
jgi:hypothetical protein